MQKRKNILVIEDDNAIREILSEILENEGFNVQQAVNGKEGIEKLESYSTPPSLIVLDLMMPIMDGFAFRKLQMENKKWASIPVLVLSADAQIKHDRNRIQFSNYLRKPLNLDDFINVVNKTTLSFQSH